MPTKRVTTTFTCDVCGNEYEKKSYAESCEKQGVALLEFIENEVVEIANLKNSPERGRATSGRSVTLQNGQLGVVYGEGHVSDSRQDPHHLPGYYEVWISSGGRKEIVLLPRDFLKRKTQGTNCPFCGVRSSAEKVHCIHTTSTLEGFVVEASARRCPPCGQNFFTTKELRQVKKDALSKIVLPVANTRRLINNFDFQS